MFTNWAVFLKDKKPLQSRTLSGYCVDWFSDQNDYIKLSLTMVIDNICAVQRVYVWNNCVILSGYWFRFCSHKPLIVKLWSKINFPVLLIYCFNVLICFHFRRGWMDYFLMHFSVLYSVFTLLLSIASAEHGLSQLKFVKANLRTK